jgi:HD superfamily phosphohydrolase
MNMIQKIRKAKKLFKKTIDDFDSDPYRLLDHVLEVEKWAKYMLKKYPEADKSVVMLSVWLHDIGHYPLTTKVDHAVRGEQRAKKFLEQESVSEELKQKVLHCVRAHRCKDVLPKTLEAKIIAFVDSASHLTDDLYFDIARKDKVAKRPFGVYSKIDRDLRDLSLFPEIKKDLFELKESWVKLLKAYEKIDI